MADEERVAFTEKIRDLFTIPSDLDKNPESSANLTKLIDAFEGMKYGGKTICMKDRISVGTQSKDIPGFVNDQPYIGVKCVRDFKKHELVTISPGIYLDRKIETQKFYMEDFDGTQITHTSKLEAYAYDWGDKWELVLLPNFFNHSCSANVYWSCKYDTEFESSELGSVGIGPVASVHANRDIKAGEFISIDYDTIFYEAHHHFDCFCGSDECRGSIKGFTNLPIEKQDNMLKMTPYMFDPTWLGTYFVEYVKDEERRKKLLTELSTNELMPKDNFKMLIELIPGAAELLS